MTLDLADYKQKAHKAVEEFWGNRDAAKERQLASGKADQGERAGVTSGKNMDGFLSLIIDVVNLNGLSQADIHMEGGSPVRYSRRYMWCTPLACSIVQKPRNSDEMLVCSVLSPLITGDLESLSTISTQREGAPALFYKRYIWYEL